MKKETILKGLYEFICDNYEMLKNEYKVNVKDKKTLPFTLFCIAMYAEVCK